MGWEHMGSPERCSHRALSAGGNGPRVQVSPERTQVHEGRTVRLYCRAAGVPSATITWRKEGGSLPTQVRRPIRPGPQAQESPSICHLPLPPVLPTPSLPFQALITSKTVAWVHASLVPSWALILTLCLPLPFPPLPTLAG